MANKQYKLTLSLSDGRKIDAGTILVPQGDRGETGSKGATFTPSVSEAGVLSWTNNGGLTNPTPVNIKGPKGDDAVITAADVAGWGFTKNKGTVTSVAVKMNGATKGTVTSSGTIDLGTVLTDASKFATSAQGTKADNAMPKSGGTFTGEVKFGNTENFQGYYIKRMLGHLGAGTAYNNLDSKYKDGTYHRMWRLRFPSGSDFWGKIKVTLYGGYSSFNASGVMSKSITCNFNTSNIYNNVGCYDGLGVNVEQDFRISEAIWNATANAWEVLIWQKNLSGNNSPTIMLECWTTNNTKYINAFNGIAAQTVELTQSTSYSAQRASSTGGTKTVMWETLPVYENPLGEEIATVTMLEDKQDKLNDAQLTAVNSGITSGKVSTYDGYAALINGKQDKITSSNKLSSSLIDGLGAAAAKAVDTAISANSTSTNLPTSKAVEDRINAHSGIDKVGTVTGVKMNGTTKNPSSGVVDLGTVITAHQSLDGKQDKITSSNKLAASLVSGLATVATSGSYNDLSNKPTIPTVNNGKLIIQKNGTDVATFTANQSSSATANITVPTKVSDLTNDSGYTTNKGTVTSVAVKMNGATKGTVTSSGTIDLGTVITDVSGKLDKTTYEWNKEFRAGSNGAISLGRYNVYDTQLTFDISSTTTISMNGKLVIATQNGRICQAKVFGDATGVLVSKIVIYQSAIVNNRSWVEVFCNFDGWSKNKVHIYGVALESATVTNQMSSVTFTNGVPSPITSGDSKWSGTIDNDLSGKANLSGSNTFTGDQLIKKSTLHISGDSSFDNQYFLDIYDSAGAGDDLFAVYKTGTDAARVMIGNGVAEVELNVRESAGTDGQVLTSKGAGKTPMWTTPPQFTLSGTTLTITV